MDARWDVAVLVGSLRKESFNRKMANALLGMAPPSLALEIVEIRNLPLYNQDDDANPPAASAAFKARIQQADATLFVTPNTDRRSRRAGTPWTSVAALRQERVEQEAAAVISVSPARSRGPAGYAGWRARRTTPASRGAGRSR